MSVENWRAVPGYEGSYEVSDLGRVRSLDRVIHTGRRFKGKILAPILMGNGYIAAGLYKGGSSKQFLVHRLVLISFVGLEPDLEVLHANGDRADNRLANLSWGTRAENARDAVRHGTHRNTAKTHCPQGHPYTPENTYREPVNGNRSCRTCRAVKARKWVQIRKMRKTA